MLMKGIDMATLEVDFEVYKALTTLRPTEATTYNEVIRKLLNLKVGETPAPSAPSKGATFKGVFFPDGTQFEATYKGRRYTAAIKNGLWTDSESGQRRTSPSDAVNKITSTSVNGWRFWRCKRPGDTAWTLLDKLQ
jgi:hypothetical protein